MRAQVQERRVRSSGMRAQGRGLVRFRPAFEILRGLELFAPVSDGELMKFAALGRERRVERGSALDADGFYREPPLSLILEGGALLAWGRGAAESLLRALEPGDLVGEAAVFAAALARGPRNAWRPLVTGGAGDGEAGAVGEAVPAYESGGRLGGQPGGREPGARDDHAQATTRALTLVRLIEWDLDAVREALRRWPDVAIGLLAGLARRQRELHRRVAGLCGQRASRRLALTLASLLEERGVPVRDASGRHGLLLPRTPSRTRLGALSGLARETVSRLLAQWARRGWITTRGGDGGDIMVLDRLQWRRLTGGEAA